MILANMSRVTEVMVPRDDGLPTISSTPHWTRGLATITADGRICQSKFQCPFNIQNHAIDTLQRVGVVGEMCVISCPGLFGPSVDGRSPSCMVAKWWFHRAVVRARLCGCLNSVYLSPPGMAGGDYALLSDIGMRELVAMYADGAEGLLAAYDRQKVRLTHKSVLENVLILQDFGLPYTVDGVPVPSTAQARGTVEDIVTILQRVNIPVGIGETEAGLLSEVAQFIRQNPPQYALPYAAVEEPARLSGPPLPEAVSEVGGSDMVEDLGEVTEDEGE